tara:strand:+ start:35121 stop:35933 length:813 start_codon:yes stop_codon:yes gene_type:complete
MTENLMGKPTEYPDSYSPDILLAISRIDNRKLLGLDTKLPFIGKDIWNAYELSWLNKQGLPQVALARFHFACESPNLIESKSLKLYLNSLNQESYENEEQLQALLIKDLSEKCGADVKVELLGLEDKAHIIEVPGGNCLDKLEISVEHYHPAAELLSVDDGRQVQEQLYSNLFRSNCPITNQPDWATISIAYSGSAISHESLLAYLISYRLHNDYHENCVEKIFVDIQARCKPTELTVRANFLRRGGLDINPVRSSTGIENTVLSRLVRQ